MPLGFVVGYWHEKSVASKAQQNKNPHHKHDSYATLKSDLGLLHTLGVNGNEAHPKTTKSSADPRPDGGGDRSKLIWMFSRLSSYSVTPPLGGANPSCTFSATKNISKPHRTSCMFMFIHQRRLSHLYGCRGTDWSHKDTSKYRNSRRGGLVRFLPAERIFKAAFQISFKQTDQRLHWKPNLV